MSGNSPNHTDIPTPRQTRTASRPLRRAGRVASVALVVAAFVASTLVLATPSGAIVNGGNADAGEYPWMVALRDGQGHFCGGSIISPTTVVTAAHCLEGVRARDMHVQVGVLGVDDRGQRLDVDRIMRHPSYDGTVENDIALLRTDGSFRFSSEVAPIAVRGAGFASAARVGNDAWATGWGALDEQESGYPDRLREVRLPVLSDSVCNRLLASEGDRITNSTMLCAGGEGPSACYGDSGGPLMARGNDGVAYLIGLTSWGVLCGEPGLPGVYSEVGTFASWIAANTPDLGGSAVPQPDPGPGGQGATTKTVAQNRARARLPEFGSRGRTDIEIPVSGADGSITDLNVRLFGLRHSFVSDLTILLIAPDGTRATLMAEVGGDSALRRSSIRFNDEARRRLPAGSAFGSGAYKPTDNAARQRPPARLSTFDGIDPNGTWTLRIIDPYNGDSGRINGARLIIRSR